MPSNDHDLALIENLERLRCSGLPEQWIRDYPHGLTEADCLRVQQQIEEAGYWPLDPQQFAHHLQELYAAQSTPIRRARAGGRRSIAEIQTPTTQSDAAWFDGEDFARRHPFVEDGEHNSFWLGRSVETNGALGHEDEGHDLALLLKAPP